jgi:hypothetical protein
MIVLDWLLMSMSYAEISMMMHPFLILKSSKSASLRSDSSTDTR